MSAWEQSGTGQILRAAHAPPEPGWGRHVVLTGGGRIGLDEGLVADAWSGAGWGFIIGAGVGGGTMFVVCSSTYDCPVYVMTGVAVAVGGVLGAAIGALIGSSE